MRLAPSISDRSVALPSSSLLSSCSSCHSSLRGCLCLLRACLCVLPLYTLTQPGLFCECETQSPPWPRLTFHPLQCLDPLLSGTNKHVFLVGRELAFGGVLTCLFVASPYRFGNTEFIVGPGAAFGGCLHAYSSDSLLVCVPEVAHTATLI